jgi:hypothetical protein
VSRVERAFRLLFQTRGSYDETGFYLDHSGYYWALLTFGIHG